MFLAAISALRKALSLQANADAKSYAKVKSGSSPVQKMENMENADASTLTQRQQVLLGMNSGVLQKQNAELGELQSFADATSGARQRPPRVRSASSPSTPSQSSLLVPVHQSVSAKSGRTSGSYSNVSKVSPGSGSKSGLPVSPFQSPSFMSLPQNQTSPVDAHLSPWAKHTSPLLKDEIASEEKLEQFLADVEDKLVDPFVQSPTTVQTLLTPPPTLTGVSSTTPSSAPTPASCTSTPRSTSVVRSLRPSSGSQKFRTSPRKTEGDLPLPMTLEQATEGFQKLGVFPQIEDWRDQIRQWFSNHLLSPLVQKLDSSHIQVMQTAAKLGVSINVSPVGGSKSDMADPLQSPVDATSQEWLTSFTPDEDAVLHQLRAFLVQARDAQPAPQSSIFGLQLQTQIQPTSPLFQECLDAVNEHQRLRALMKGEWAKGLLPRSSVRADCTVQRIRELAEGTCVKKYEYLATGELYDKIAKRWTLELPSDSHLLVYLFCALLEYPNWMLHVDPASYPSTQSGNNPLFVAGLPHKERFPEKYVAILSTTPAVLHPGACVLSVGKQSPPVFALYWDKKLQFSLQGRTALWDASLLLCHRIKVAHSGVVRGINLGSSAFSLLSIFETPKLDDAEQWKS